MKKGTTTATKTPVKKATIAAKKSTTPSQSTATQSANQKQQSGQEHEYESLLEKLFINLLKDIYWAEKHLTSVLPKMQEAATTEDLRDAFEDHLYATHKHISRLEKVFRLMGRQPEGKKCDAMEGLTKEGEHVIQETKEGTMTRDAGLIISAQKIEHYEIAAYGSLVQLALTLDQEEVAEILEKTLWEEEDTDLLLTDIAESSVNPRADDEPADDEEENDDEENMLFETEDDEEEA